MCATLPEVSNIFAPRNMYRLEGKNGEALREYEIARHLGITKELKKDLLDAIERTKVDVEFKKLIEQL